MRTRIHQRFSVWLALVATALYALWPLLATAQPRGDGGQYELCPHVWMHRAFEESHHQKPTTPNYGDHLLKCAFSGGVGDGSSPIPDAIAVPSINSGPVAIAAARIEAPRVTVRLYATSPRGPPALS